MSPTPITIDELFATVDVPEEISGARVYNVKASATDRTLELTLYAEKLLPYETIEDFKETAMRECNLVSLIIRVKYHGLSLASIDLNRYWSNLIFYVNAMVKGVSSLFTDSECGYENGILKITCHYGTALLAESGCDRLIEKLVLAQLGESVKVELVDVFSEEQFEQMQQEALENLPVIEVHEEVKEEKPAVQEDAPILGKPIKDAPIPIKDIREDMGIVTVCGEIFEIDSREMSKGSTLYTFFIGDNSSAYSVKFFVDKKFLPAVKAGIKKNAYLKIRGQIQYDTYANENVLRAYDIEKTKKVLREDNAEEKRIELHMHTKMSTMDGVSNAKDLINTAIRWGHKAIAVTDHGNIQAFPEAMDTAVSFERDGTINHKIKVIYGVEAYIVNDSVPITFGETDMTYDGDFVVFDIETTGLRPANDGLTEIGAVKVSCGKVCEVFNTFVNPERPIPENIVHLTGITDEMVADAPKADKAVADFLEFAKGSVLVAHNANFDTSFIKAAAKKYNLNFSNAYIDTLELSRTLVKELKNHKLNTLTKHFNVKLENHHRACDDAAATAEVFIKLMELLAEKGITTVAQTNSALAGETELKSRKSHHATILVRDYKGLYNLYQLISKSCMEHFYKHPIMPKSLIEKYREGLLIGSACEAGELYRAVLESSGDDKEKIADIVRFYDYLEIQPLGNNKFMVANGTVSSDEDLKYINKKIVDLAKENGKLIVAAGDVHFLNPEDEVYRRILMAGKGFKDADDQAPLYLRTTDEMLAEFDYLGDELAHELVIENPAKIADMTEYILPIPTETAPPIIDGSDDELRQMTYEKAKSIYGDPLPDIVKERIDVELSSIIDNGYSVMYIIAQKLVKKSNSDGYLVGSRGSVGSSLVAFFSGITEVNSLPPHHVCPNCKYSEFITDGSIGSGFDLKDKVCPECGTVMKNDGHDIPFETFLGFGGGKEPDIDLNFSGEYQGKIHKYTEEIFGEGFVFRAGTIGTVADKTAFGYVKKYFEERGQHVTKAEIARLVRGCTGVKNTTGQHAGGLMIVPRTRNVHEFTPIQYPADKADSGVITTHFDYHSISGKLLKLDLLGHDDPTVIRMLEDLTGIDAKTIPAGDPETMSLFKSTDALGVTPEDINSKVGTYAVPEFGTHFVRQMLVETEPTTFSELVRISGLSHGTDVWTNNAQDLVRAGTVTLKEAICTRDDIMLYLIQKGVAPKSSFKIMEMVRKGKGLTEEYEAEMREANVPEWYIKSCKTIKYMFPKAHAVAYVTMAYRIAWFKVHYPIEFYMAYFTVRADVFDALTMAQGHEKVKQTLREYEALGKGISAKDKGVITILEVCNEMYARGIEFLPINIFTSHAYKFQKIDGKILPPLNAIPGLGTSAAESIVEAREEAEFTSIEDIIQRSKANKTVLDVMKSMGAMGDLPESSQMSFF
ncbi:MAG: PolC-type DNA polymerase III [Clostridia bacterium]|nr:PolC-type DNA polymerase III [Clostridia bacterium]